MQKPKWADIIQQLQAEAGISQREIARRSGICRSALRRALSGDVSPTLDVLEKVLDVFGYDIDAIPRPLSYKSVVNCNNFTPDVAPEKPAEPPRPKIGPHFGGPV
jgi:transcriptional regulator with XRE-family HTH domain